MSKTLIGVDGPVGWTDFYTTRAGVRGSNTIFKPEAVVATDLSVPRFYRLTVRGKGLRPVVVATGSFKSMLELWKELGLGDNAVDGSFAKKADYASIAPLNGRGSNLFASRDGGHRRNLLNADLVITAPTDDVLNAWVELSRLGWKADLQVA